MAQREGGTPKDFGEEAEAVHLATPQDAMKMLNKQRDKDVLMAALKFASDQGHGPAKAAYAALKAQGHGAPKPAPPKPAAPAPAPKQRHHRSASKPLAEKTPLEHFKSLTGYSDKQIANAGADAKRAAQGGVAAMRRALEGLADFWWAINSLKHRLGRDAERCCGTLDRDAAIGPTDRVVANAVDLDRGNVSAFAQQPHVLASEPKAGCADCRGACVRNGSR